MSTDITPYISIGNYTSSYDDFDVIVNLNFPYNDVTHHNIIEKDFNNKKLFMIGLLDAPDEEMLCLLKIMMPKLLALGRKRILFHCYAGISRSSTAAIMYFMMTTYLPLEAIFRLLLSKRSIIDPNPAFRHILHICNHKREIMNT